MKVPTTLEDQHLFILSAIQQGVKIQSRYKGVYLNQYLDNAYYWLSRVQKGGKTIASKRFPLTKEGEKEAGEFYINNL